MTTRGCVFQTKCSSILKYFLPTTVSIDLNDIVNNKQIITIQSVPFNIIQSRPNNVSVPTAKFPNKV